jgi:hypothetical protein
MPIRSAAERASLVLLVALATACGATADGTEPSASHAAGEEGEACPSTAPAPAILPHVEAKHRTLAYWLGRASALGDPDAPLLTTEDVADHNRGLRSDEAGSRVLAIDLGAPVPDDVLLAEVNERLSYMRGRAEAGELVDAEGERITGDALAALGPVEALPPRRPERRVALAPTPLHCGPRVEGLFTKPVDRAFDRNLCSTARAQEVVEILAAWPNGTKLARTRYAMGFVEADAPLSAPIPEALAPALLRGPRAELVAAREVPLEGGGEVALPAGTFLPPAEVEGADAPNVFVLATADGFRKSAALPADATIATARPLTRRALLTEAFRYLGSPYGWGDRGGARDCSRFLLDVFTSFGLELPRHSGRQAASGTFVIDVAEVGDPHEKQLLLASAARSGIVLLHFPGHIMLYLGETEAGVPMAIHAFSEYLEPCDGEGGGETLRRVDRVEVSDLTLGEGTSRKSFLERLTKIVVLGRPAKPDVRGAATFRPSAPPPRVEGEACQDSADAWIVSSPASPTPGEPLRVVVALTSDPAPARLVIYGPDGAPVPAAITELGGPPYGYVATVAAPAEGVHTAVLGDGGRVVACERVAVSPGRRASAPRAPGDPAWVARWRWERDTENLYALFVEHLFRSPDGSTRTWTSLSEVLRDRERNLLYDHLGLGEDERLRLVPDCADLSYVLRAYFAWKLKLPFAFRRCSRGRAGVAPTCGEEVTTNLEPLGVAEAGEAGEAAPAMDEVEVFQAFSRLVSNAVHSASARTLPTTDHSDHYPVALERASLVPGTTFADPYGHLLVLAQWRPQGVATHGALIGADAQPDGTVGQRIFWRGTFLFTPETTEVGAGFKAWRPLVTRGGELVVLDNDAIGRLGGVYAYSDDQYEGTADDFYDRMADLINPRPLSPQGVMESLVAALYESVQRRVVSVQTGEDYMRSRPGLIVDMPTGHDVFETAGAWEDFATPSRDMRLLISIDAVLGFPDDVRRRPERFGVAPDEAEAVASRMRAALETALEARSVSYQRSNAEAQALTLAEVVARRERFELAYNPNDCVEVRWAAAEGTDEMASCARHAPAAQRARMDEYRAWFRDRRRPPR